MYRMIEVVGTSPKSIEQAINAAIEGLDKAGEKVYWFEVLEQRGAVREGKVAEYQVKINAGVKAT
jgi:flavin-binding protein dodecin